MGLEKLIVNQITGAAANAFKMDIVIDSMKGKVIDEVAGKVEEQVPVPLPFSVRDVLNGNASLSPNLLTPDVLQQVPEIPESQRQELLTTLDNLEAQLNQLIDTKNRLQGSLDTLRKPIETLEKLADTLGKVIPTLKGVVLIIRNLPLPTAVPPGIGLPATVLNNFSNTLDVLKVAIDKLDGPVSVVSLGVEQIAKVITPLLGKIKLLDPIFTQAQQIIIFIRALLLYGPFATQQDINDVASDVNSRATAIIDAAPGPLNSSSGGEWRLVSPIDGISNPPTTPPPTPPSPFTADNGYVYEWFADDKAYSDFLLGLLTPPVVGDGLIYRGYQLTIEYDGDNKYPFPARRIVANFTLTESDINPNDPDTNFALRLLGSTVYNLPDEDYSFSSSVQVLISEAYYEIDRFIDGKQSIQKLINDEYIFDSNGIAIGRIPGRPGFTFPPSLVQPNNVLTPAGGLSSNATVSSNIGMTANLSSDSRTAELRAFEGGIAMDAVIKGGNNPGLPAVKPSSRPRIFQTYIDRFPNDTFLQKYGGFFIIIESGLNTTTGGESAPVNVAANPSQGSSRNDTAGRNNATASGGKGSSNGSGTTPPPPPNPFSPFNSAGYNNEIKLYAVPNTNPVVIRTYKFNSSTNKWVLIATTGGTGGGKGGGGGSPGGSGGFGGGF